MPNMTPEELRKRVEIKLLWMTHIFTDREKRCLENNVLELLADLCGEILPEKHISSTRYSMGFNAAINLTAAKAARLTGKEIK